MTLIGATRGRVVTATVGTLVTLAACGSDEPSTPSGTTTAPLAEDRARHAAAALSVDSELPVALEAPALPPSSGARVGVDFWTAALGVHVCGAWLPNAPSFGSATGVHSHGDPVDFAPRHGQVIVLGFDSDEAPPGAPPQMSSLFVPSLGADTTTG